MDLEPGTGRDHPAGVKRSWILAVLACVGVAVSGCNQPGGKAPSAASVTSAPTVPTVPPPAPAPAVGAATAPAPVKAEPEVIFHLSRAQTNLPMVKLYLGPRELEAELCTTVSQVATGLMFRKGIGTNEAMFFAFATGQDRAFYMKNVDFPIAAAYIDSDGIIQEVVQLKARDVTPVPSKSDRIQFVLETAPDWFTRNGVGPGTLVTMPEGELRANLVRRARIP